MGEYVQVLVAQSDGGSGSLVMLLVTMLPVVVVFYFMMIRPERKKQQEHQSFLGNLKKGDEIVLTSGIIGKIQAMDERTLTIEVADKVRVRVLKVAVSGLAEKFLSPPQAKALEAKKSEPVAEDKKVDEKKSA